MCTVGVDRRHFPVDFNQEHLAAFNAIDLSLDLVKLLEIGEGAGRLETELLSHD